METKKQTFSLANQFLIAMPDLADPNFHHSVAYIFEHTEQGAMGIVLNQPLDINFGEVLSQLNIKAENTISKDKQIYLGGPVQPDRGFVIHSPSGDWQNTYRVSDDTGVTVSLDIIQDIASGKCPDQYMVALGYAGWGAGQLEEEIANNVWINGPISPEIIYNTPAESRWHAAAAVLGIDTSQISSDIGHA